MRDVWTTRRVGTYPALRNAPTCSFPLLARAITALASRFNSWAAPHDACGALNYFSTKLERITGPLADLQLREVMVEMAFLNLHLKNRPTFHSIFDPEQEKHFIGVNLPELELHPLQWQVRVGLLLYAMQHALPHIEVPGLSNAAPA